MGGYGAVLVLLLAGFAALRPDFMPWAYLALALGFELWLSLRIKSVGSAAVAPGEPPYAFDEEEAALVGRFRFYFTYPEVARHASSTLAATGLSAIVLAPWLIFKLHFVSAALVGLNLLLIAKLTRVVAPVLALRIAASKGDRQALRALELHGPVWEKIKAANQGQGA